MNTLQNRPVSFLLLFGLLLLAIWLNQPYLIYFVIGGVLGAGLNYFQFGFRTCSQQLLIQGKTLGIRAVLLMLMVTTLLFFPLLNAGHLGSQSITGLIEPLSLSVVAGAFMFGVGMQLSNGCTSGTFNKLGQLQPLSFTVFVFLVIGGTLAAYNMTFWREVPALPAISLVHELGLPTALVVQLSVLVSLYALLRQIEKKRHHAIEALIPRTPRSKHWHPWLWAVLLLALFNALLLVTSGKPWSIASVFPLWGVKLGTQIGLPVDFEFWDYSITYSQRLDAPVWQDTVSLTTWGVIFGAGLVSLLNRFSQKKPSPSFSTIREHLFAILGGLLMGYGAVIAFGCNIGAFFSGIGSGSLHGWLWALSALMGNALIITLRRKGTLANI